MLPQKLQANYRKQQEEIGKKSRKKYNQRAQRGEKPNNIIHYEKLIAQNMNKFTDCFGNI